MLILANATIQRPSAPANGVTANAVVAPTFFKKVGPFEVHRATPASAATLANAQEAMTLNGKSLPLFLQIWGPVKTSVGAAYMNDTQQIGLIPRKCLSEIKLAGYPLTTLASGPKSSFPGRDFLCSQWQTSTLGSSWCRACQADPQVECGRDPESLLNPPSRSQGTRTSSLITVQALSGWRVLAPEFDTKGNRGQIPNPNPPKATSHGMAAWIGGDSALKNVSHKANQHKAPGPVRAQCRNDICETGVFV